MKAITIETDRFYLEKLSINHLSEDYVQWMNDETVVQYLESGGNYNLDLLREFLSEVEMSDIYFWAIKEKTSHKHIGNIKIDPINYKHGWGEYGILLGDKSFWGKGVGFEISQAVIHFCFNGILKLRKINLGVRAENKPAIKLYSKLGFETEGIYKKHAVTCNGYDDVLRMAIFNPKFQ